MTITAITGKIKGVSIGQVAPPLTTDAPFIGAVANIAFGTSGHAQVQAGVTLNQLQGAINQFSVNSPDALIDKVVNCGISDSLVITAMTPVP